MAGIKETQEAIEGAIDVANLGIQIGAAGFGLQDLPLIAASIPKLAIDVPKAIDGAGQIPAELSDLSEEEAAQLVAAVMVKLGVGDGHAKDIVAAALKAAAADWALVKAIVNKPVA